MTDIDDLIEKTHRVKRNLNNFWVPLAEKAQGDLSDAAFSDELALIGLAEGLEALKLERENNNGS